MKNRFTSLWKKKTSPVSESTTEESTKETRGKKLLRCAFNLSNLAFYFLWTFFLLIVLECFARRSVIDGLLFPFSNFVAFAANYFIIIITLLPALFIRRRIAFLSLITALWLALGVTQFVLTSFRVTPLTAVDFTILPNVITIINVYLKPYQLILIIALILLALAAIIYMFIKLPKQVRVLKKGLITLGSTIAVGILIFIFGFQTNTLSDRFPNLLNAYHEYGFAYCFSLTIFDKGIDKPDNYSKESIDTILGEIEAGNCDDEKTTPNVIMVQLESLFDVNRLKDVTFSQDPLPNLTALREKYESGYLAVPVIGAGTVNTEFEVLTGMSTSHFGPGEYPFRSILRDETCETIAYTLAKSGYATHALHNHQATFYSRHIVYQNLGFSSFTPLEFMIDLEYNETGWAKDSVLTHEIFDVMSATQEQDFVFAVSVQGHGKYPDDYKASESDIHIIDGIDDSDRRKQFNFYLKQIQQMDAFVGELTAAVMAHDEPTLLVFYGDHLPSLGVSDKDLTEGNIYQTEYVILANYDLKVSEPLGDLHAYQLYPTVTKLIGNHDGVINSFHHTHTGDEDFLEKLEMLEYDLLYGKGYAYGDQGRYPTNKDMTLGTREIAIEDVTLDGNRLRITGKNFNEFTTVYIDGDDVDTTFVDSNTLTVSKKSFKKITLHQVADRGDSLWTSTPFYAKEEE